jgi:AcrR family transcriptional regulator
MVEKVKGKIIAVAQETFKKYGFRKTTMDEIAYAAGKGKSSLYYYFKSKEEVFRAVVELEAETLKWYIRDAITNETNPKLKLKTYVVARMQGFNNMANFYVAVKDDFLSNLDFIEDVRKRYDLEEIEIVSSIIQNGIASHIYKKLDVPLTARTIVTIMKGLEIPMFMSEKAKDIETNVDEILDILFFGICL